MNCINVALRDFVFVAGLVLAIAGVICLLISMGRRRAAELGKEFRAAAKFPQWEDLQ